jgi:hypothetical protein
MLCHTRRAHTPAPLLTSPRWRNEAESAFHTPGGCDRSAPFFPLSFHLPPPPRRWRYEADVVAHAIAEATNRTAGYALPASFFWPATRRGILALAGPAATVAAPTSKAFLSAFAARRRWLLRLAVLMQRTAADPRAPCDAPWVVTDAHTGHRGKGYRGRWATPGWPWPFQGGVGVVPALCHYADGATQPAEDKADCCSPIFGKVGGEEGRSGRKGKLVGLGEPRTALHRGRGQR